MVTEQEKPDGNFPTCPYPNPEIGRLMQKGLELCDKVPDLLLVATDPDCDRVGTAVPGTEGRLPVITGNEMGIILLDYICRTRKALGTMPEHPVAVTTIVSTDMATPVAAKYGVELRRTLTGFKFIGEQIGLLEAAGKPTATSLALRKATATCPALTSGTRTPSTPPCWCAKPPHGTQSRA